MGGGGSKAEVSGGGGEWAEEETEAAAAAAEAEAVAVAEADYVFFLPRRVGGDGRKQGQLRMEFLFWPPLLFVCNCRAQICVFSVFLEFLIRHNHFPEAIRVYSAFGSGSYTIPSTRLTFKRVSLRQS